MSSTANAKLAMRSGSRGEPVIACCDTTTTFIHPGVVEAAAPEVVVGGGETLENSEASQKHTTSRTPTRDTTLTTSAEVTPDPSRNLSAVTADAAMLGVR